jgi:hypothetical protein
MPYGCDPILTSFTSITTSSSDCSGEDTKRTYQGLWRMSDVEGRADMALRVARSVARRRQLHWLRRCDPRYAPDALPRMDCGRPPACQRGGGALGPPRAAFAPPLRGTTSARWSTLAYVEKVRPQFLSLRQLTQGSVFSRRTHWQLSPVAVAISNLNSGLPKRQNRPIILRKGRPVRKGGKLKQCDRSDCPI